MVDFKRTKKWILSPLWLLIGVLAIVVACGGDDAAAPAASSAPAAKAAPVATVAAAQNPEPTAAPQAEAKAPAVKPVTESQDAPRATATPVPAPKAKAIQAKITRVSMANPPPLIESNRIWEAAWSILLQHDPYGETLIENHEVTSEAIPALAHSWKMENGFEDWTFYLEENVPWHYGYGEFTSADVAHTQYLVSRDDANGNFKGVWIDGQSEIIDDHTIKFTFDPPAIDGLRLFSRLAGDLVIHSKAQWDAAPGDHTTAYDEMVAGTGSYQYAGRKLGSSIWYEKAFASGEHWAGEDPDFQELEWVWANEQFTRLSLLLAGEVQGADLARDVWPDAFSRGMAVVSSNNENNQSYGFFGGAYLNKGSEAYPEPNAYYTGPQPWHNPKVREAMNRAIDRDAIKDTIYAGNARPAFVPVYAPFTEGWNDRWETDFEENYGYDKQRAIDLLAAEGYGPGDLTIEMVSTVIPGNPEIPQLHEALSVMWEEIGINTKIQDLEIGTWVNEFNGHFPSYPDGNFTIIRNTPIRTTQEGLRVFFASEPDGFAFGYEDDFTNEKYACLRDSVDADVREKCAREAGDYIYDMYAMVPLFQTTFDMVIDPVYISEWQYPGVGSAHPTHVHNIKACPVGTDSCD